MLAGSPSAAVRRRGGHEDVRQSQSECQFTHLPPEQEVLRKIKTELGETWSCLWTVLSLLNSTKTSHGAVVCFFCL